MVMDDEQRKKRLRLGWEIEGKSRKYAGADIVTDKILKQTQENLGQASYQHNEAYQYDYRTNHEIEQQAHTTEDFRRGIDDAVMPTLDEANQKEPGTLQKLERHAPFHGEDASEIQNSEEIVALQEIEAFGQRVAAKAFAREHGFEALQPERELSENPESLERGRFLYLCQNAGVPDYNMLNDHHAAMLESATQSSDPFMASREANFANEMDHRLADLAADMIYHADILNDSDQAYKLNALGESLTAVREEGFQQLEDGDLTLEAFHEAVQPALGEIIKEVGHPDLENLKHPPVDYNDPALVDYQEALARGEVVLDVHEYLQSQKDEKRLEPIHDRYLSQGHDSSENEISQLGLDQRVQEQNTRNQEEEAQEVEAAQVRDEAPHEDNAGEKTDRRQLNFAERVAEKSYPEAKDQSQTEKTQSQENEGNGGMS